ncbi:DUF1772 domain-containing protein [Streptomyces sp. A7024]|uniref:DUF1772 domain-containing protein n=1 Tax=Streptomyces coryli TaxID=1128680 RepID=A0A6G4U2W6_9ACTN|nr:anthrone oxygenase family protein [Streptomyces coryli]NGN66352.1 DUF1772 domain-containing protein [Streptomyces coryli]
MKTLQTVTLLAATLATGLMAGLFAGFAYAVMPGLGRSSDRTAVEAMQNINKAILNPAFMLPFMGAVPLLVLATVLAWRGQGRAALPWIIAALVLYLVAFGITSAVNVPLNDQLAKAVSPDEGAKLAAARGDFESTWVTWNLIRALVHTAAFCCLLWGLVVYGADRLHESRSDGGRAPVPTTQTIAAYPTYPSR